MKTPRSLFIFTLILTLSATMLTGCYTKVVRDDSVEGRLSRATGQTSAAPKKEPQKTSSWWPW